MPLLLAVALTAFLAVVGRAVFALLGVRLGRVRTWLLSPAMGLAATAIGILVLNQAGLPVGSFARWLAVALGLAATVTLMFRRPGSPAGIQPFLWIAALALVLGGWPALVHGFGWLGYGNDDMTNYCLAAQRFLDHGFYTQPTLAELKAGDYAQMTWLMYVAGLMRFGSEHLLSLVSGVTGLPPVAVFMPVILSVAVIQLCGVMALVLTAPRRKGLALAAGGLLATAPLWHYGTMYQLIAQVSGLALLLGCLALTARTRFPRTWRARARLGLAAAVMISGLGIYYPEVIPFYVIGWAGYMLARPSRLVREFRHLLPTIGFALTGVLVLLRHNVLTTVFTLLNQASGGMDTAAAQSKSVLFPYFLTPVGPAFFFGFDVIVERYAGPWLSCALPLGFLLLGALVVLWLHALRQRAISAMVLGGMFFVGYRLFATVNGFGLFKLAMFALPFALVEFARVVDFRGGRWLLGAVLLVLVPIGVAGSIRYTAASLAGAKSLVGEVFDASRSLGRIPPAGAAAVWSDVDSSPVAKLLMLERRHPGPLFLSQSFLGGYVRSGAAPWPDWAYRFRPGPRFDTAASSRLVEGFKHEVYVPASVNGLDFLRQPATEGAAGQGDIPVVTSQGELRAFNQLEPRPGERSDGLFAWAPFRGLENHLVFVNSRQGQHYYLGDDGQISVYKPEPDVYDPRGHFFVIGRHLLFRVLNPSATVRIRLSLTDSVLGQGRTALPAEARAKGTGPSPVPFGLVGAGSANVVSPPLQPFHLAGADYVALDLGRPTIPIGLPAEGLEGIYNRSVSLDSRSGVAYCRDISALSEERYAARPPLSRLSRFPADLVGPHAPEYSGIYEDGWVSGHAFVRLGPVQAGSRVSGLMQRPTLPGVAPLPRRVTLLLDGVPQFTREIPPGDFRWEATCPRPAECVKIELVFDGIDTLPAPDLRPAAALLTFVQIQPAP